MTVKDILLALCVVVAWGVNFVVIKLGLQNMPLFLLAGLRFMLVAFPAIFFIKPPKVPLLWLVAYGMTISFGQFAFLFLAIKLGMPAGLASLVIQAQAFFTILLGTLLLGEKLRWNQIVGCTIAVIGIFMLAKVGMKGNLSGYVTQLAMMLTLAAALSWGLGNITSKIIMRTYHVPVMSLVVWSALVPVIFFLVSSFLFEGKNVIIESLVHIQLRTLLALMYLAFIATIFSYAIWGKLLSCYETWRVAPLSLLVPVVGLLSAALFMDEQLSAMQFLAALVIITGLLVNVFGARLVLRS